MLERTFVFADLAGYTALTEAHGDDDAARIALTSISSRAIAFLRQPAS